MFGATRELGVSKGIDSLITLSNRLTVAYHSGSIDEHSEVQNAILEQYKSLKWMMDELIHKCVDYERLFRSDEESKPAKGSDYDSKVSALLSLCQECGRALDKLLLYSSNEFRLLILEQIATMNNYFCRSLVIMEMSKEWL